MCDIVELTKVQLSEYKDYFVDAGEEEISVLSEVSAAKVWKEEIESDASSYFRLPDTNWVVEGAIVDIGVWVDSYNQGIKNPIKDLLSHSVSWQDNSIVYYMIKKNLIFQTTWKTFTAFWDDFISVENDCPILVRKGNDQREAIIFQPLGRVVKVLGRNNV